MTRLINICIEGQYKSISKIQWSDVPPFAILTGVNGSGKTQLLEVLAESFNAYHPSLPRGGRHAEIEARAHIEGDTFAKGEVFHSHNDWPVLYSGPASEEEIKKTVRELYQNKRDVALWTSMAQKLGVELDEAMNISEDTFRRQLTPALLWGHRFPTSTQGLSVLFLAYRVVQRYALNKSWDDERIVNTYGEPPWKLLNEILETADLPFRVGSPEAIEPTSPFDSLSFAAHLVDLERKTEVPIESLSSGERIIMSTLLWRYGAELTGRHYRFLLLDEPDAHLHPSFTRRFLNVIQRVFVEERGIRVIMSTHSPSTVALSPSESLFEMRRTGERIVKISRKADSISLLTGGFVAVQEATQTVFVEGKSDPEFYQQVWYLLTERSAISTPGPLKPYPNIVFIHGKGKETVESIVRQLRDKGLHSFHGIIDRDEGNVPSDGVHVLSRNAMENYLFDPLCVWVVLHQQDRAPPVANVNVPRGRSGYIRSLPDEDLQAIADTILSEVEEKFSSLGNDDKQRHEVKFVGGKSLSYPKWTLTQDDKEIARKLRETFQDRYYLSDRELIRGYATLNMVPDELLHLFKEIQGES